MPSASSRAVTRQPAASASPSSLTPSSTVWPLSRRSAPSFARARRRFMSGFFLEVISSIDAPSKFLS